MNAKNPAAVALARLRRGVKERPSELKRQAVRANLAKARLSRWPAKLQPGTFAESVKQQRVQK